MSKKEQKLVPELRFPGFDDQWEVKELGELFQNSRNKGYDGLPIYSVSQKDGLIPRDAIERKIQSDADPNDSLLVEPDDIVYNMMRMWQGAYGLADTKCIVSPAYIVLSAKEGVIPVFYNYFFNRERTLYLFMAFSYGLTLDRLRLYYKDFARIKLGSPHFSEQAHIASFLTSVDKRITLLQKKKEALEQYKKGIMQKIFSREVRFKDDQGNDFPDWEEKRLGDVCEIVGGGTPSTGNEDYWNGGIQWFTPTEIKNKHIFRSKRTISIQGLKNSSTKLLPVGTLLLTSRATIADIGIAKCECTTNQGFQSLIPDDSYNSEFIYYWILVNKNEFIRRSSGSTFLEIPKREIKKIDILLPDLREQQKIADFLSSIDKSIDKVSTQIEASQNWKKGLLQRMFV